MCEKNDYSCDRALSTFNPQANACSKMLSDCKTRLDNHSRQWIGVALTANFSKRPSEDQLDLSQTTH